MQTEQRLLEGIPVLELTGRFDAHTVSQVKIWLAAQAAEHPQIVIDLMGVTFVDSAALATLVQGMKQCRERNGDLALCNLAQPVRIIFELTRLDRAFGIYDSVPAAIVALQAETAKPE